MAIRFVVDRKTLPLNLHGLMGPQLAGGVYVSRDLLARWRVGATGPIRPIVINDRGVPDWASAGEIKATGAPFRAPDAEVQLAAVRQGLGMTRLPCFVGDADPMLTRAPGTAPRLNGALWILTQGDSRNTKRVRLFIDFVSQRLAGRAPLLMGSLAPDE